MSLQTAIFDQPPITTANTELPMQVTVLLKRLLKIVRSAPKTVLLVDESAGDRNIVATVARVLGDIPSLLAYDVLHAGIDQGLLKLEKIGTKTIGVRSLQRRGHQPEIPLIARRRLNGVRLKVSLEQQFLEWLAAIGGRYVGLKDEHRSYTTIVGRDSGFGADNVGCITKFLKRYRLMTLDDNKLRTIIELTDAGWAKTGGRPESVLSQSAPEKVEPKKVRKGKTQQVLDESRERQRQLLQFVNSCGGQFIVPVGGSWQKTAQAALKTDTTTANNSYKSALARGWLKQRKDHHKISAVGLTPEGRAELAEPPTQDNRKSPSSVA